MTLDTDSLRSALTGIRTQADMALLLLPTDTPASVGTLVKAGGNLQAALDAGGVVNVEDGASFVGSFNLKTPGTRLYAPNASLIGPADGPTITVPPQASDIQATVGKVTGSWLGGESTCVLVGSNSITDPAALPRQIVLTIGIPTFRGKRGFGLHGADITLLNSSCHDVYYPNGEFDSQGVLVLNASGPITVHGGVYEAGSENFMSGGGATGVASIVPNNLLVENVTLSRPLAWHTDGVKRFVKNIFEIKSGTNITLRNAVLDGCWPDGQTGWALMLTPRDGKRVGNVVVQDVTIQNAGGVLDLIGYDDEQVGPQLVGLTLERVTATVRKAMGTGRGAQWQGGPANVTIDACNWDCDAQIVYVSPGGAIWNADGTRGATNLTKGVAITGNRFISVSYGISVNGYAYGLNWQQGFPDGVISGNSFVGPTALAHAKNLPAGNVYAAA